MLSESLSRAAAFLGQHSRMGHTRCFEDWNCIPAQWDLHASPVLEPGSFELFFFQKHSFLHLQRIIHQQEMLLFKLSYKNSGQHEHTAQCLPLGSKGCQEGITGLASEGPKLPEILKYPSLQTQEHAAVPLGLQISSSPHSSHSSA